LTESNTADDEPIVIKKYANRRLYNTATSSYVTLDYLCQMVKDGNDFVVYDAKTGEDITRSVLAQIIFEEESKGQNLLPIQFLRQLIRFYGDSLQSAVPRYLEMSMESFTHNQEKMRDYITSAFGANMPANPFEEIARQNMAIFDKTLRMFSPFETPAGQNSQTEKTAPAEAQGNKAQGSEISDLKEQLNAMQRQLEEIAKNKS
jgi:polyhydroxyalkanoate synthesis repressor PhaR